MKRLYSILSILLISVVSYAQPYETNPDFNRTRNWHFGQGVELRFDPDSIYVKSQNVGLTASESISTHTDKEGNVLLYSIGTKVFNAQNEVIQNGNLAFGSDNSRMGSVFAVHPESPDSIFLFNTNFSLSANKELTFNLIVKESDSFRIVIKDSILQTSVSEPLAVINTHIGNDVWIVCHKFNGNTFISYRLTKEGLVACPVISTAKSYVGGHYTAAQFAMKFSTDGNYLIKSNTNISMPFESVEIYQFNHKNGVFDFLYSLEGFQRTLYGLNFSKVFNNIYVVERDFLINVFSFNPNDSNYTTNSKKQFQLTGYQYLDMFKYEIQNLTFTEQLAVSVFDSVYLAVFHDNQEIDSISSIDKGISLEGIPAYTSLPNFNQSYYFTPGINFTVKLNCIVNTIQFYGQDTFNANSHSWLISKQGTNPITANTKTPLIEFEDTGDYNVRYIASNGSKSDTLTKEVTILPKIAKDFLGNDTGWCETLGSSLTLKTPDNMHCYEWSNGSTSNEIVVDTTGSYFVKITTPNFCVLYDTINVVIDSIPNVPEIYKDNDTLKTNTIADLYQWFRDDINVGFNEPRLVITDTGVYELQIRTFGGCSALSDTLHVPDTSTNSINLIEFNGIKIYPNPFESKLVVSNQNGDEIRLKVYDINGKVIYNEKLTSIRTIKTDAWTPGIYLIKLTSLGGHIQTYKLIKL